MRMSLILLSATLLAAPLSAQTIPSTAPATGAGRFGNLGSLMTGALPSVAKVGTSNAAGVIGYCVKNNYLNGTSARSILGKLTGQAGVAGAPGYAAGQAGTVQAGNQTFNLASMKSQVTTKVCDMVLKRGASLVAR